MASEKLEPTHGRKGRFRLRSRPKKRRRFRQASSTEREALGSDELVRGTDAERELLQKLIDLFEGAKTRDDAEGFLEEVIMQATAVEFRVVQEAAELTGLGHKFRKLMTDEERGETLIPRGGRRTIKPGGVRMVITNPASPIPPSLQSLKVERPSKEDTDRLAAEVRLRRLIARRKLRE